MSDYSVQTSVYGELSTLYGNAASNIDSMVAGLYDGFLNVILIDDPDVKIELFDTFRATYDANRIGATNSLLPAARRLNAYILSSTTYETIDEFLADQGIFVTENWADLSGRVGSPISASYII